MILDPFEYLDHETTCSFDEKGNLFFFGFIAFPMLYLLLYYCFLCFKCTHDGIYFFYLVNFTRPPIEASELVPEETIKEYEDL